MSQGVGLASCLPKTAWPPDFDRHQLAVDFPKDFPIVPGDEGRLRQVVHRDGQRADEVFMGVLRQEWERRHEE